MHARWPVALAAAALAGCGPTIAGPEVEAEQRGGVWVFTYAEPPAYTMDALGGGPAAVVGDCLLMGDAVVIWHDDHLGVVDDVIARVLAGEALELRVGGGGSSVDEGSTTDDFPPEAVERCAATAVWYTSDLAPEIEAL